MRKTMKKRKMYDKNDKELFMSEINFAAAKTKAIAEGYTPVGRKRNKDGEYMIFARKIRI